MILRVFRDAAAARGSRQAPARPGARRARTRRQGDAGEARSGTTAGPGTRYLAERTRARHAAAEVPELAPLRPVLERFVTAERVERHDAPPLVASVFHLVPRGDAAAYTDAVEAAAGALRDVRISVSGPWAPYAFAPDALA
jgi:hypothetical protein